MAAAARHAAQTAFTTVMPNGIYRRISAREELTRDSAKIGALKPG
ncbi:MAG: hypothetical protein QE285_18930 [Aquabacterium sp.]|nr:hypothetical protein [Aquabacterium sp.]